MTVHNKTLGGLEMSDTHKKEQKESSFNWKPWLLTVIVVIIALFVYTQFFSSITSSESMQNNLNKGAVVATVNGNPIYEAELNTEYSQLPEELKSVFTKEMLLNSTIVERLVIADAQKKGITVSEEEVEQALQEASDAVGVSKDDFFVQLEAKGINQQEAKEKLKNRMLVAKLYDQLIQNQIPVSEEDAKTYYNTHNDEFILDSELIRVSHILVKTKEEADTIYAQLKKSSNLPQDFAQTAANKSLDTGSAVAGGDLNFAGKGMFGPEFEEAAFKLSIGQLSEPVKTQFGYHIIYFTDKKEPGLVSFEEVSNGIRQQLQSQQEQQMVTGYIDGLMQSANIQFN